MEMKIFSHTREESKRKLSECFLRHLIEFHKIHKENCVFGKSQREKKSHKKIVSLEEKKERNWRRKITSCERKNWWKIEMLSSDWFIDISFVNHSHNKSQNEKHFFKNIICQKTNSLIDGPQGIRYFELDADC